MNDEIIIEGIETNNLKNINVKIIKKGINLIIGPSGSGKSSLAYDTIAQIGQHEFLAMFADEVNEPSYKVRSFSHMVAAVPIKQSNYNSNMRSTIGTYFGMNRSIGLIYAILLGMSEDDFVLNKESNLCENCHGLGYVSQLDYNKIIDFNVQLKKVPFKCWNRYKDFYSQMIIKFCEDNKIDSEKTFRELTDKEKNKILYGESKEKYSIRYKKTNMFSRRTSKYYGVLSNIPMMPNCGIGKQYYSDVECECCHGKKYGKQFDEYKVQELSIGEFMTVPFSKLQKVINNISKEVSDDRLKFTIENMKSFIDKAVELKLGHLCFHRAIPTLSGGELQRLRMVQVFTTQLSDLLIVLDEPLAGLSGEEKKSIFSNVVSLAKNHTLVLVDHGDTFCSVANNIIALGEKGGSAGGNLINATEYLKKQKEIGDFSAPCVKDKTDIILNSAIYGYKGVNICIANECMNLLTGYSGVGKSTLLREYFPQFFNSYLYINQKPVMGNKNSSVATVLDIANKISELFAKKHKKDKKFFSNLTGNDGTCPLCAGAGYIEYGNDYHQATRIECRECEGTGFNKILKKYKINNKSIFDVWKMPIDDAMEFFSGIDNSISKTCKTASGIMLGHLHIGQATGTLSGGENIRVKIIKASKANAKVIGIDEPFKGLSNVEIDTVARYLDDIRRKGKTIVVIDHTTEIEKYFSQWMQLENQDGILVGKPVKI
ncbi:MAG: ATP-binding cassette domain-containing protein [Oscillospiraceae bacterium]|jgi:excinuclease UvrABC ATPase subunit|nr:ATP-binding cassette domain-containing protein [Oscillospiraceae bacterium]MCI2190741.1 ATP-binding cassette domain-containing protein [Oscillospiraceae bacterium]MCI2205758.1 ATP-binding cassette domain-containing protein [Oscillospiraceae bacterium]